ncbi:MAG: OadG family protein [Prolixibacteraceae bacterium]|nr:OadG family protein [Prolixibacteraceae bacterium]
MNDFGLALELLGVGMITVFIILSFVVVIGNLIIRFVNKYIPEEKASVVRAVAAGSSRNGPDPRKIAAITSAVSIVTRGKGKVTKIEKM